MTTVQTIKLIASENTGPSGGVQTIKVKTLGMVGPAGADGAPGASAYELAVEGGFAGTQEEWLNLLQASTGSGVPSTSIDIADVSGTYTFDSSSNHAVYHMTMVGDTTFVMPEVEQGSVNSFTIVLDGEHQPTFSDTITLTPSTTYNGTIKNYVSITSFKQTDGTQLNGAFISKGDFSSILTPPSTFTASGSLSGTTYSLTWDTVTMPTAVQNYTVEVSQDNFATIDSFYALSSETITYSFTPPSGVSYIRVKATDLEGNSRLSNVLTSSWTVVTRSDNQEVYYDLRVALNAVQADYPTALTQDVTVTVENETEFANDPASVFYYTMHDWNQDSNYALTIDGKGTCTLNGSTTGVFKLTSVSNVIFKGINFINISNHIDFQPPEQTCAVYAQGTRDLSSKNIVVVDCTVEGRYPTDATKLGRYAFIFKYLDNVSILNTDIQGFQYYTFDVVNIGALSLTKVTFSNGGAAHYEISQPCVVNIKLSDYLLVEDCEFNMNGTETFIITSNLKRLYLKRTQVYDANGEFLRLQNSVDMEILDIESCMIKDNLKNPLYPYILQNIAHNSIKVVNLRNNTIQANPRDSLYYGRFSIGEYIGSLNMTNNVFSYYGIASLQTLPYYTGFRFFEVKTDLENVVSKNNIIQFYTSKPGDDVQPPRNFFIVTPSHVVQDADSLFAVTGNTVTDIFTDLADNVWEGSTAPPYTANLFAPGTLALATPVDSGSLPKYELYKREVNTWTQGAYQLDTIPYVSSSVYEYEGIDTFDETVFTSDAVYDPYSGTNLIFRAENSSLYNLYKWEFLDADANVDNYYGTAVNVQLFSRLNESGSFVSNLPYSITLTAI